MRRVKIQYVSDLHLERKVSFPRIPVRAPYLILPGDIGCPYKRNYRDFLRYCSDNYKWTGLVLGNHEYLSKDYRKTIDMARHAIRDMPNVKLLHRNTHLLEEQVLVAGCTLWTPYSITPMTIDGKRILASHLHDKDSDWLKSLIERVEYPLVVATHHLPSERLIGKKYKKYNNQKEYASNLDHLFNSKSLKAWLCGHSHDSIELYHNDVYLGLNAGDNANMERVFSL